MMVSIISSETSFLIRATQRQTQKTAFFKILKFDQTKLRPRIEVTEVVGIKGENSPSPLTLIFPSNPFGPMSTNRYHLTLLKVVTCFSAEGLGDRRGIWGSPLEGES
jgi:hypothetical protein